LKKLFRDVDKIEESLFEKRNNIRSYLSKGDCNSRDIKLNIFNMQMQVRELKEIEIKAELMMNRFRSASNQIRKRIKLEFERTERINKLCFTSPNFVFYDTEKKSEGRNFLLII
jgi:hypothetical protein